jgi:hypothetical protein
MLLELRLGYGYIYWGQMLNYQYDTSMNSREYYESLD